MDGSNWLELLSERHVNAPNHADAQVASRSTIPRRLGSSDAHRREIVTDQKIGTSYSGDSQILSFTAN